MNFFGSVLVTSILDVSRNESATNFSSLVGKNLWRSPFVVKIQTKALKFDINQLGSLRNKLLWILIRHLLSLLNPLHVATWWQVQLSFLKNHLKIHNWASRMSFPPKLLRCSQIFSKTCRFSEKVTFVFCHHSLILSK